MSTAPAGVGRRLLSDVAVVGVITFAAKAVAGVRDIVLARTFGVGAQVDAYFIAFTVPSIAAGVLASAVSSAVVPAVLDVRERSGPTAAQRLFSNAMAVVCGCALIASVVLAVGSAALVAVIGSGFGPDERDLAQQLLLVMAPIVVVAAFGAGASAGLLAQRRFVRSSAPQVINPLVVLVALLVAGASLGIRGLSVATLVAFTAEAVLLGFGLSRTGVSVLPRWHGLDGRTRTLVGQFFPVVLAILVSSLNLVVDQALATPLGPGSVSALGYGSRLVMLVFAVGAASLSAVALPHFSEMVSRGAWREVRKGMWRITVVVVAVSVPVTVLIVVASRPIVSLVFGGGAFTAGDVDLVAGVQQAFALQIPFYTLLLFYARILNALQRNQLLLVVTTLALVVNAVADVALRGPLGVAGIALATSLVVAVEVITLGAIVVRLVRRAEDDPSLAGTRGDGPPMVPPTGPVPGVGHDG